MRLALLRRLARPARGALLRERALRSTDRLPMEALILDQDEKQITRR